MQVLRQAGCIPVGPAATLKVGLDLVRREDIALDVAVLDIDLRGEAAWPLAEVLRARGVPFVFLTGYGAPIMPAPWRDVPRLEKPFEGGVLLAALRTAVAGRSPARSAPPDVP